ncbi:hypothetical protein BDK51DRAFT_39937 [Blyttiomyces helicus]|uniref:Uncharacterized protein n=1 Tax=Blyttiomyces helicus TaxID=388810 RepID=A0A4P9WS80_9FUNG|nr:hypothetical protein BDK51DRAFT_39937 [Blyttiomyces helicus]|eukprot:RKO93846.1 hypothetical protein BDK51DRAFT_39937 [Blyttiomyces helicus]
MTTFRLQFVNAKGFLIDIKLQLRRFSHRLIHVAITSLSIVAIAVTRQGSGGRASAIGGTGGLSLTVIKVFIAEEKLGPYVCWGRAGVKSETETQLYPVHSNNREGEQIIASRKPLFYTSVTRESRRRFITAAKYTVPRAAHVLFAQALNPQELGAGVSLSIEVPHCDGDATHTQDCFRLGALYVAWIWVNRSAEEVAEKRVRARPMSRQHSTASTLPVMDLGQWKRGRGGRKARPMLGSFGELVPFKSGRENPAIASWTHAHESGPGEYIQTIPKAFLFHIRLPPPLPLPPLPYVPRDVQNDPIASPVGDELAITKEELAEANRRMEALLIENNMFRRSLAEGTSHRHPDPALPSTVAILALAATACSHDIPLTTYSFTAPLASTPEASIPACSGSERAPKRKRDVEEEEEREEDGQEEKEELRGPDGMNTRSEFITNSTVLTRISGVRGCLGEQDLAYSCPITCVPQLRSMNLNIPIDPEDPVKKLFSKRDGSCKAQACGRIDNDVDQHDDTHSLTPGQERGHIEREVGEK